MKHGFFFMEKEEHLKKNSWQDDFPWRVTRAIFTGEYRKMQEKKCIVDAGTVVSREIRLNELPNQHPTLNKLSTELRCRNFVNKHRLSMQIGATRRDF